MELKVVIDKKFAFMIVGAILILAGAIYGYAYGGNTPSVMGHSWGEIDSPDEANRWAKADEIDWSQQITKSIKMDRSAGYDIWIQGGASETGGDDRNLALLGVKSADRLHINHAEEYDGNGGTTESVRIYGDTRITGDLDVDGDIVGVGGNLNCNIRTGPTNKVSTATCTSSYTLTGGGCQTTSFNNKDHHFYPSGNSYICQDDGQPLVAYAICCKIT